MKDNRFDSLIARLEQEARARPRQYQVSALGIAFLGFGVLGVALLFALAPLALFVVLVMSISLGSGALAILLFKFGKLLFLLIVPAWVMIKSSVRILFARFPRPQGREITRAEAPELFRRIDELRRRMNGPRIHHVLLTDEFNAAIVQHPRLGLFGWEENYLILGLQLLQVMSEEEALSVVAHEYGHLSGYHSRLGGFIYRFRSAWGRLQALSEEWTDWGSKLIARLMSWYAPYFNAYTFVLARQHEYAADRAAAEMTGADNTANALLRTRLAGQFLNDVFWPSINRLVPDQPQPPADRSTLWERAIGEKFDEPARLRYFDQARKERTDHLDTHPTLNDRLQAIGMQADDNAARNLLPPAQHAAQAWLGARLPDIQQELDRAWYDFAAENWQQRHRQLGEWRERLDQLHAQETLSIDERWEEIKLVKETEPETDVLPRIDELLQLQPDHVQARYLRGVSLLDNGDEAGMADLESVMRQDADATLPACEAAWRFYRERDEERAEHFRRRWIERTDYENRVRKEFQSLPTNATLAAHDMDDEAVETIRGIIRQHGKYIRRAYLLRRILKTDETRHDYVLAFETRRLTFGDKGAESIKQLARQEFPESTFIVHLGSAPYKSFRKPIKRLGVVPIYEK